MAFIEKGRPEGDPIPKSVLADRLESISSSKNTQEFAGAPSRTSTRRALSKQLELIEVDKPTKSQTAAAENEEDEFDWNTDDSIILKEQRATAAYRNPLGELVIRQRTWPDEDTILFISPENEVAFLEGLAKRHRES
jgi:hypothetical protein